MAKELKDQELNEINGGVIAKAEREAEEMNRAILTKDELDLASIGYKKENLNAETSAKAAVGNVRRSNRFINNRVVETIHARWAMLGTSHKE
ncbi:MAG: hypothetical protein Q4E33_03230 [Erysipelotrichaceae bacterium]|nr:hypothetical protein [Erysipelotrichaceae bacterium]